jgi:hypothetical protein
MKIIVSTDTETWTSRCADPDDEWDSGDTDGRVSDVTAFEDRSGKEHYSYGDSLRKELDVKLGDLVYAVVADYSSGSTFGRSGGHSKVMDVFATEEEADSLAEAAKAPPASARFQDRYNFTHNGTNYSRAWVGHFESLNSLDVWAVNVRRDPADPLRKGTGRYSSARYGKGQKL